VIIHVRLTAVIMVTRAWVTNNWIYCWSVESTLQFALPLKMSVPPIVGPLFRRFTKAMSLPDRRSWEHVRGIRPTDLYPDRR
jgi:hypothetical protein